MKKIIILLFISMLFANTYKTKSPNKKLEVQIDVKDNISLTLLKNDKKIFKILNIDLIADNKSLITKVAKVEEKLINEEIKPTVPLKEKIIQNNCSEYNIKFKNNNGIIIRLYNNGLAYRFYSAMKKEILVNKENFIFETNEEDSIYFPEEESFHSHNERYYKKEKLVNITDKRFCSLPTLVQKKEGYNIIITESDLVDYAGLWLKGTKKNQLESIFPYYPDETKQTNDRNVKVLSTKDYIAKTQGNRQFPWRIFAYNENDKDILTNQLVYILASESKIKNTDWIKPGKVAWDWYNANNIYNVDFESGLNTLTYKYFIDFAAQYKIEYIILDEGWYKLGDLRSINPDIDLFELIRYGKEKNVDIILWASWKTLDDQLDILEDFAKWGIKGIKVDFMQRDDQWMVNYYTKVSELAAKYHLLVDFHGAYKPAGLHRTYPNVLTFEGVRGNEQNKWSDELTPNHNTTLPFIRMFAGPMDYTPGAMLNAQKSDFKISFTRPMSLGTRCHQLGMYVIYESPLQMLCDNPTNYLNEPKIMDILSKVPVTWDKTIPLEAKIGDYVIMARKNGNEWFIGGMNDWTEREFEIKLDFLDDKEYQITICQDGVNADKTAIDYKIINKKVKKDEVLKIKMSNGGGYLARIYNIENY